ncbi:MAG: cytosine permease [Treponema sp. CETP13]|nr:MAG: cytosine permease [Treponema sp. CETP13]
MEKTKTGIFSNGLIWFGASISIAEILTGTLLAPLGFTKGILAILLGHLIGCSLMYFAGLIGANTEKSAMETVKISFGQKGALVFVLLNILQLVGWTAVMIFSGADVASSLFKNGGTWLWALIIGALIVLWIIVGIKNITKINIVAVGALFVLTLVMSVVIFRGNVHSVATEGLSFGCAVELSVAMPLSWLPLISDYTRFAKKKNAVTFVSSAVYFIASSWMYLIGMGIALLTHKSDFAQIMLSAGLGVAGLLVIILSTVTTTFLDVYSAGVSCVSVCRKVPEKIAAIVVCLIGLVLAIFTPVGEFENFLYLIGSVFAPMTAILITDYFILKKDTSNLKFNWVNLIIWLGGFIVYRLFMNIDTPVGYTLPVMIITAIICILIHKIVVKNN